MAQQSQPMISPEPADADLERTADLPMPGAAAGEAAWQGEDVLARTDSWLRPPPLPEAAVPDAADFRGLSEALLAVEERLQRRSERVLALEGDLETLREARATAEKRALGLDSELAGLRALLEAANARASRFEQLAAERATAARAFEERGAHLAAETEQLRSEVRQLRETLAERDLQLARHAGELSAAAERAAADARESAGEEIVELRRRVAAYLEALRTRLGRHEVYESACAELDAQLGQRELRIAALQRELDFQADRVSELESTLAARDELDRPGAPVQAHTDELTRAAGHERRLGEQEQALAAFSAELVAKSARIAELEVHLGAAEAALLQLEGELRGRAQQLEERESLIERLQREAAGQAASLGEGLQESIQRLERLAQTGSEAALEGPMRLLIRTDGDSEIVHVLGRRTTIGRTPDNDLQLDTKFISRHHAVILAGPAQTILEDLDSTNGVLVNNRRITRHALQDGDHVLIGKTAFRFVLRRVPERH